MAGTLNISGPISVTIGQTHGIKYVLFGDEHYSWKGICDKGEGVDIEKAIDLISESSLSRGEYVDFYLEESVESQINKEDNKECEISGPLNKVIHLYLKDEYKTKDKQTIAPVDIRHCDKTGLDIYTRMYIQLSNYCNFANLANFANMPQTLTSYLKYMELDLFNSLFLNNDKIIDSNIYKYYKLMLESNNFKFDYNNLFSVELYKTKIMYINKWSDLLYQKFGTKFGNINNFKEMLDKLIDEHILEIKNTFLPNIYDGKYILKYQLDLLNKSRIQLLIKEKIIDYGYYFFENVDISKTRELILSSQDIRMNTLMGLHKPIKLPKVFPDQLIMMGSILIDLYTLSIIYYKFKEDNQPSVVIYYAGDKHIENILGFLSEFAQVPYAKFDNNIYKKRCVEVPLTILEGPVKVEKRTGQKGRRPVWKTRKERMERVITQ